MTLVEVIVAIAILSVVILPAVYAKIFPIYMRELVTNLLYRVCLKILQHRLGRRRGLLARA